MANKNRRVLLIRNMSEALSASPWMDGLAAEVERNENYRFTLDEFRVAPPPFLDDVNELTKHLSGEVYDLVLNPDTFRAVPHIRSQHLGRLVGYAGIVAFDREAYDGTINTILEMGTMGQGAPDKSVQEEFLDLVKEQLNRATAA